MRTILESKKFVVFVVDLFPSISLCDSNEVQELAINLLYPFYEKRESYGPNVLIALVNCLGQIAKVCLFYSLQTLRFQKTNKKLIIEKIAQQCFQLYKNNILWSRQVIFPAKLLE